MQQSSSNYFLFYPGKLHLNNIDFEMKNLFLSVSYRNYDGSRADGWHYTIQSIPIVNKTVTIHKNRYDVGKMLGKGAFGEVYVARRLSDSKFLVFFFFLF
jgi:hypothetical protein